MILYKYRQFNDNSHRILTHNEFYFSSTKEINDPFDLMITPDLGLLDTDDQLNTYFDQIINDLGQNIKPGIDKMQIKKELIQKFKSNPSKFQEEWDTTEGNMTNMKYGVLSFSERWDSLLMWSHYADNHKGFCVGVNKEVLTQLHFGTEGPVNYVKEFPNFHPNEPDWRRRIIYKTYHKSYEWAYEKEYRFTQLWPDHTPTKVDRKIIVPNEAFSEIILGLLTQDKDSKWISEEALSKKIPVYKMVKRKRSFLLDKIQIQ